MSRRSYPRYATSTGAIYRSGTPVRCEVCGKTIADTEPRVHCWIQVNWMRGDDEDGYAHVECALNKYLTTQKQVDTFNAQREKTNG